jgi:N-acetyltransferase
MELACHAASTVKHVASIVSNKRVALIKNDSIQSRSSDQNIIVGDAERLQYPLPLPIMSTSKVQRTYGSRNRRTTSLATPSSPPSALASSPPPTPPSTRPSKRNISELLSENVAPLFHPSKRMKTLSSSVSSASKLKSKPAPKNKSNAAKPVRQKALTQLHFNIDQPTLRTCPLCELSYTKGAPDDEHLHRAHCTRVRQGLEWGREEEKDKMRGTENVVIEVRSDVKLKGNKKKGRIICFPADIGGKVGSKVNISRSS